MITCTLCGCSYKQYRDVIDMRGALRPTCWSSVLTDEAALVRGMVDAFDTASLADLVNLYVCAHRLPREIAERDRTYMLSATTRELWTVKYMEFSLERYAEKNALRGTALDAGCGSGGALPHLCDRYAHVVGVDPDLAALLVAAKRCEELGVRNRVTLVAGTLEQQLFSDGVFAAAKCTDVLEHVVDPPRCARHMARTLEASGALFVLTPNKFSLFGPEPHVRLWGVQFLPRRMADAYVQQRVGVAYSDVAHLLSAVRLRRALSVPGLSFVAVPLEDKHLNPQSSRGRRIKRLLGRQPMRTALRAMRFLQPSLEAVCRADPATRENP